MMIVNICWYCGSQAGLLLPQPDGNLLHEHCEEPAARDYPNRPTCDAERADAKVAWLDQRDYEDEMGTF